MCTFFYKNCLLFLEIIHGENCWPGPCNRSSDIDGKIFPIKKWPQCRVEDIIAKKLSSDFEMQPFGLLFGVVIVLHNSLLRNMRRSIQDQILMIKVHTYILRRPQVFTKSPLQIWLTLHGTNLRWWFSNNFEAFLQNLSFNTMNLPQIQWSLGLQLFLGLSWNLFCCCTAKTGTF